MAAYNFGMLTAGLPDLAQRQVSQQVVSNDSLQSQQNNWLQNWQGKWNAATPQYVPPVVSQAPPPNPNADGTKSWLPSGLTGSDAVWARFVDPTYNEEAPYATSRPGYYDNSARNALEAERAKKQAEYSALMQGRQQNQQTQQSAYDQANGGGFSGGIINASYGTPFGNDPTMSGMMNSGIAMPNNQPWGSPAYGGPQGGESQAGFGGGSGMMNTQPAGWGGPFSAKNPWALS